MEDNSAHGYSEGSEEEEAQRISKQLVQNIDKQIQKIKVNAANLEHITKSGEINGSLFMDIKNLILEKEIELKRKDEEIANHIAVNSLLTDSDGEAYLANKLFKAQKQIQQLREALKEKDEEIAVIKDPLGVWSKEIKSLCGQLITKDEDIKQLKEILHYALLDSDSNLTWVQDAQKLLIEDELNGA